MRPYSELHSNFLTIIIMLISEVYPDAKSVMLKGITAIPLFRDITIMSRTRMPASSFGPRAAR